MFYKFNLRYKLCTHTNGYLLIEVVKTFLLPPDLSMLLSCTAVQLLCII